MRSEKTKLRKRRGLYGIGAAVLAVALVFTLILGMVTPVSALTKTADGNTTQSYTTALGDESSTRYAGRVWTDKTVYDEEEATFTGDAGNVTVKNDSDFLVAYSALATSKTVIGTSQSPVDVVFVIDLSGSMSNEDSNMDNGKSRIANLVDALNTSIEKVLSTNPNSRIGVVGFEEEATTLLELDHYTKREEYGSEQDYFSLNRTTGNRDNATLRVRAVKSNGTQVNTTKTVSGGTNTHMGMDAGMDILRTATGTTVEQDGETVSRVPALIFLSDGSPTYSGADSQNWQYVSWWDPSGTEGTGYSAGQGNRYDQGDAAYEKFAMKTIMNAAYNKQQVNAHYNVTNDAHAMRVYTIGMGVDDLDDTTDLNAAKLTLNPKDNLNANNTISNAVRTQWNNYLNNRTASLDGYTFRHPTSGDINSVAYNDAYYTANNADAVNSVFDDITSSIIASAPEAPTLIEDGNAWGSGYLTYTDPIGDYMEVKDVKTLIYGGQEFTQKSSTTSADGNTTTYTFSGEINSDVYGEKDASVIEITVTKNAQTGNETLTVKIPAAAIPLRINTVEVKSDGTITNTNNGAYPVRVLYTVGLREGIEDDSFEGLVSDAYITANTEKVDGKDVVNFYSNKYSGGTEDGTTVGDATVTLTPAKTNPFYYIQENTPLYTDKDCKIPATGALDSETTYYFEISYYEGNEEAKAIVSREGSSFTTDSVKATGENNQLEIQKGSPRLGYLNDFVTAKETNETETAGSVFYPVYNEDNESFTVYLGNNGKLQLDAPKSLTIEKEVTADDGLTAPDKAFEFELTIADKANKTVNATVTTPGKDGADSTTETKQLSFDKDGVVKFTLKDGQSIKVPNIGAGTEYTIEEVNLPTGFTISGGAAERTEAISNDDAENVVTYTNKYSVTPTDFDSVKANLSGTKSITGRQFKANDEFTFTITGSPGAPLPETTSVTIKPTSDTKADFAFDNITFTKPGTYTYTIKETTGDLPGVSYDSAEYTMTVKVKDNGDGTLSLDGTPKLEKKVGETTSEANKVEFTNSYSAKETTAAISGKKVLKVTNSDRELEANDFEFTIVALGSNTNGSDTFTTDSTQPMPDPASVSNNAAGLVSFSEMTFTQDMIGKTYGYKITEKLPNGVTADNNTQNGITYDTSEKIVKITVDRAVVSGEECVQVTITPNENGSSFTFTNSYEPTPVTIGDGTNAGIKVQKTFTGRAWGEDDVFEYVIKAQTENAPMPADTTLSINGEGAKDSVNSASFGEMTFEEEGEYKYVITETKGSLGGVTYDNHTALVTVTVTEDTKTGTLSAAVSYENPGAAEDDQKVKNAAAFTNTYAAVFDEKTTVNLNGTKKLIVGGNSDKTLTENAFYFTIEALDKAPLGGSEATSGNAAGTGNASPYTGVIELLKDITYTMDDMGGATSKDFVYLIKEQIPDSKLTGMTYDESVYQVTVTVTDNGEGKLSAAAPVIKKGKLENGEFVGEAAETIEFENSYTPEALKQAAPEFTKELTGDRKDALKEGEFSFEMSVENANPEDGITLPDPATATNDQDGKVAFDKITFTKAGTYKVKVKEVVPADADKVPGVTYDTHEVTIEYTVVDENGQLTLAGEPKVTGETTFINRYETTGNLIGKDNLKVTKDFTGRKDNAWLTTDAFTFNLEAGNDYTIEAIAKDLVVLPEDKEITISAKDADTFTKAFGDITFNAPGTYVFKISENGSDDANGITYDTAPRFVTVKAEDQGDGTLKVELVSIKDSEGEKSSLTFKNTYATGTIDLDGAANLEVEKKLTGRDWQEGDSFTFTLNAKDDATKQAITDKIVTLPDNAGGITITNETAEQKAAFGNITFTKEGIYTFVVAETVPEDKDKIPGVTYDGTPKTVTVEVKDNGNGTLTAAVVESKSDALTFTNIYKPDSTTLAGAANLEVTKTFTGRVNDEWLDDDEFEFTLAGGDEATLKAIEGGTVVLPNPAILTIDKDTKDHAAAFGDITFEEAGDYTFTVTETKSGIAGVVDDTKLTRTIKVEVVDNKDGTMTATVVKADSDNLEFTNTYVPTPTDLKGAANLEVTKYFTGRVDDEWLDDDVFTFTLEGKDEATKQAITAGSVTLPDNATTGITIDKDTENYKAAFGNITFSKAGTYKFVVKETKGDVKGVIYDTNEKTVTVVVTDNEDGTLTAAVDKDNSNDLAFTNTYDPESTILEGATNLKVTKNFTGRVNDEWLDGDKFEFTLAGGDEATLKAIEGGNVELPNPATLTIDKNTADHAKAFGDITFKKAGNYTFTVTESASGLAGVKDDSDLERTIKVKVVDNKDGTLTANLVTGDGGSESLAFTNTYEPTAATLEGKTKLVVTKDFTGRAGDEWLEKDKFAFKLSADMDDEATADAVNAGNIITLPDNASGIEIAKNTTGHKAAFGDIVFTKAGTYKFIVEELPGGLAGVTYDTSKKTVTVVVTDDTKGKLSADVTEVKGSDSSSNDLTFTNTYGTSDVTVDGATNLKVKKVLNGRDWFNSDAFEFTLAAHDKVTQDAIDGKEITMPSKTTLELTKDKQEAAFGDIEFTKAGTYKFVIKETEGNIANIGYDDHKAVITVTVTDNNEGELVAAVATTEGSLTFENTFTPTAISETLKGTKSIDGRGWITELDKDAYEFTIEKADGMPEDTPMPAQTTVTADVANEGAITFPAITYTEAGTYKYVITESLAKDKDVPGVSADTQKVTATVEVKYDKTTGKLSSTVTYAKEGGGTDFAFTNTYKADAVDVSGGITAEKKVQATDGNSYTMKGGEFEFTLTPGDNNPSSDPLKGGASVKNDAEGNVVFADKLTYTEPGDYEYTLTEETTSLGGMTYDASVYKVVVKVTDNQKTGKLEADVTITKDGKDANDITFTNKYDPAATSATIGGTKTLTGPTNLTDGMFEFEIAAKGDAPLPEQTKVSNVGSAFQFGTIAYDKPGTYEYTISEVNKGQTGVTYDKNTYDVTVTVTDNNGALAAEVDGADNIVFENTYTPIPLDLEGETALKGTKTLNAPNSDRTLQAGDFEFELVDSDNNIVDTVTNDKDGNFSFGTITIENAGTYWYTIREKATGKAGVTYDGTTYAVKIEATDDNGYIKATVTYYNDGKEADSASFTNTYKAKPTSVKLGAAKVLDGRGLKADEFTFQLKDKAGTVIDTATNDANGAVQFAKEIVFDKTGTYEYTISEVEGDLINVTYDETIHNVTVTVTDDEETGDLVADVKYGDGTVAPTFTNTFDNHINVSGVKTWSNDTYVSDMFRPDSITVNLLQNGTEIDSQVVKPDENGNWTYVFEGVPMLDEDGNAYIYTIVEEPVDGYATTANGTDLNNELQGYLAGSVDITKKVTLDGKPYNVTGIFYAGIFTDADCTEILTVDQDGEEVPAVVALPVDGTESETVTVDGLPLGAGGEPTTYYIAETDSQGNAITKGDEFTIDISNPAVTVDARGTKAVTITNDYSKEAALTGTKTWDDDNNAEGKRPESIKVTLLQNGKVYKDPMTDSALVKTVTAKDNWTYSFVNLPKTDASGNDYEYSVMETGAEADYTDEVNGMNITNTLNVEQYYYQGYIDITKKTMLRNSAYKVDDVYYAGIFTDKDYKHLLTNEDGEEVIYEIALDNEAETTISVPVPAGADGESVTYYVTEVDETGTPVNDADGLQYTCEVKGGVCSVKGGDTANVEFTNVYQTAKVPQTGDDSNIMWLLLAATLAGIAMVYVLLRRKTGQHQR